MDLEGAGFRRISVVWDLYIVLETRKYALWRICQIRLAPALNLIQPWERV